MPSTYTSNNKIQKIATGEQSGTWGNTTNTNFDLFDTAIDGFVNITLSGTTHTLNIPDGSAGDGRNKVLVFTGTLAATNTVSVTPNTVKKHYYVQNNTTGGQNIVISQGSGSSVTIKPGYSSIVYLDGAGSGAAVKEVLTSLKLTALLEATGAVLNGSSSGSTTLQASATASGTLTLPAATDTLVGKATTDTFTNKTFDTAGTGNVLRINGTQVSAVTGTGSVVLATSPTLVTPLLGTPTSGTLTNCTGLPVSTGISGLGANVATFLATPSSANLAGAVTDETGSGALVFANSPVLVTPVLGTPASGTLTNCSGLPISGGVSGLGSNVATFLATPSSANLANAVTDETGTGALVFATGPVLTSPSLVTANIGTPALGTLTNCTGLPVSTGISGLGSGVATFLATPSSANLAAAVTDETGTGSLVFGTSPTIATPTITTSATVPLVIGGTGTTSTLTLRSTSGVGTTGADIIFQTGNNGATEVMRLQNGGNVGIGTSSLFSKFTVSTSGENFELNPGLASVWDGGVIEYFNRNSASTRPNFNILTQGAFKVYTGGSNERMRILSTGEVGIGTSSPSTYGLLTVSGGSATISPVLTIESTAFNSGQGCALAFARNGFTQPIQARIRTADNGASASNLLFETKADGTAGALSERMRIDSSGNVGITGGAKLCLAGTTVTSNHFLKFDSTANGVQIDSYASTIFTNGASSLERMRIDSSGNVLIGATSPAGFLTGLQVSKGATESSGEAGSLLVTGPTTAHRLAIGYSNTYNAGWIQSVLNGTAPTPLLLNPNGGNVGIGTSSPGSKLTVSGDIGTSGNIFLLDQSTAEQYIKVGYNRSGNGYSYIDLVGDTTYSPGTRLIRGNTGANAISSLEHRGTGDLRMVNYEAAPICFYTSSSEKVRIDSSGNVKIGGTANRATTAGTAHLDIFNGTAPVGTLSNGISIYSSSGEAYVMDAAGNATLFSPHDRETNEWIFDSTDTRTGKRLKINVERLLRFINDHFGLDCVHDLMEEA